MATKPRVKKKRSNDKRNSNIQLNGLDLGLVDNFKNTLTEAKHLQKALSSTYGLGLSMIRRYPQDAQVLHDRDKDSYLRLKSLMTTFTRDMDTVNEHIQSADDSFKEIESRFDLDTITEDIAIDNYNRVLTAGVKYHTVNVRLHDIVENMATNYQSIVEGQ